MKTCFRLLERLLLVPSFLFASQATQGFEVSFHAQMTKDSLKGVSVTIGGQNRTFSDRAVEEVAKANASVDELSSAAIFFPERHFTNEALVASTQRLIDSKASIVKALAQPSPDGATARRLLGEALHTVQDFYAHSNWVEGGRSAINTAFGKTTVPDPTAQVTACTGNANIVAPGGGNGITSGYFRDPDPKTGFVTHRDTYGCQPVPAGKCFHGNYTNTCPGINKDLDSTAATENDTVANPFHPQAYDVASRATTDYIQQIAAEFPGPQGETALAALLDVKGDVAFVVDDTGSMGPDIAGVKTAISGIVTFLRNAPAFSNLTPDKWLLTRFGDPSVGPVFVTTNADALLSRVNTLVAGGGGDCPELSQEGLRQTIEAANPYSRIFFFSDASAKDAALANLVIGRAQQKRISITYLLTGSCSPTDPVYERGALETGGQLFLVARGEVAQVIGLVQPRLAESIVRIASKNTVVGSTGVYQTSLPVDSTVTRLIVSVSLDQKNSITLFTPNGTSILPGQAGVSVTNLTTGTVFSIENPPPGIWSVEARGIGKVSLIADGNSPIEFRSFDFVRANQDIHGGFFPIDGQPPIGQLAIGDAFLLGPPLIAPTFQLVDEAGNAIQQIALRRDFPHAVNDHYLGELQLPASSFRVSVTGTDASGFQLVRLFTTAFKPQPVNVSVKSDLAAFVPAGQTAVLTFEVTNLGAASTYSMTTANNQGFLASAVPPSIFLSQGQSALVNISIAVPATALQSALLTTTLTATSVADNSVFNAATTSAIVYRVIAGDVNRDGKVDCADLSILKASFGRRTGDAAFDARADLNSDGVVDVRDLTLVSRNVPLGTRCQ